MSYGETKVYFDGSHYIAIPHTERKNKYRPKRIEEEIIVTQGKRMQVSTQCDYFTKRFGRNDFKELDPRLLNESIKYLMKYIEKTGEKIVYSKGLYQYFISDIMDEDVVCTIGQEDKKLLLFDTFNCWDEGVYMGRVSPEVIAQMRKSN